MKKKRKFFIVDDDLVNSKLLVKILEKEGHTAFYNTSSVEAFHEILEKKPDCVLLDLMMPEIDGLEMCKRLRNESGLNATKIIVVSGKSYEFDRNRAYDFGADGYIVKPVDPKTFGDQLERVIEDHIEMTFWGVRGTLPVPGKNTVKYGGNTNCVSLEFSRGNMFIFDAGTGIKELSDHLSFKKISPIEARIFISHPHWDHINALPFFAPLYSSGNEFEIYAPAHSDFTMRQLIFGQMDGVHFPIKIKEFSARVSYRDLMEEEFQINEVSIKTMLLNHPGLCLGYRVQYKDRSICYITDNELYPKSSRFYNEKYIKKLIAFAKNTDALITDSTYNDQEYEGKISYGHSSVGEVVDFAHRAGVKKLFLFHHDPNQTDGDIDTKWKTASALLKKINSKTRCIAPKEKQCFKL